MNFDAPQEYIDGVLSGEIVTCRWVRLAVERHCRDLKRDDLYFDETAGKMVLAFYSLVNHSKGVWGGQPFELTPWQAFFVWSLFGWKKPDGLRRFRTAYLEVGRKNGKTTLASVIGLYLLLADNERGAEIYTAATKKEQARIAHKEAINMIRQSPVLSRQLKIVRDNISHPSSMSKFEPLGRDSDTLDGLNPHGAICDEVHAWRGWGLWDVLETGTGARSQPLMLAITTAGQSVEGICPTLHDYSIKIAEGLVHDDSFFGMVYTIDEEDRGRWDNESIWVKANPNLGISKSIESMRQGKKRAQEMPSQLNSFLRLHLGVWGNSVSRWIKQSMWKKGAYVLDGSGIVLKAEELVRLKGWTRLEADRLLTAHLEEALQGRVCYAGLDLSSTIDLTALVLVFPPIYGDDMTWILPRVFIPEDRVQERSKNDRVPYEAWVRAGLVFTTPGNVVDYDFIIAQAAKDAERYDLKEIALDRWGAGHVQSNLMNEFGEDKIVLFGQGMASMSGPTKELERLAFAGKIGHCGNPVMSWCIDNVAIREDPAGNKKPDKQRSREKIDPVVAAIMGLDRAIRHHGDIGKSVYEERGIRYLS